jgi:putative ABC transport system substrate-binding protein
MKRREFITLFGGAAFGNAAAWSLTAHAQQPERTRRIGVLMFLAEDDPESKPRIAAFTEGLQQLGWIVGRNIQLEIRWGGADAVRSRRYAAELVAIAPDVILATASESTAALREATRTLPTVFVGVTDPVGAGYVASLARPGGNATGFSYVEYGMSGKWLELLKEIAPRVTRAAVLRDPALPSGIGTLGAIQSAAPAFGIETSPIDVSDPGEIERGIADFARTPNGALVVPPSPRGIVNRKLIIALAAQHRLPAVYFIRSFVKEGGLISYGPDAVGPYRQAAGYVDRILRGEKPADLPVQAPTKFELVINLKTAKALGLAMPPALLARADEVIE